LSRALVSAAVAVVASISFLVVGGLTAVPVSADGPAPNVSQCDAGDGFPATGMQVTCSVTVDNTTSSTGATSSTVTTSACLAPAGVPYPSCPVNDPATGAPVTSTVTSTQLVQSVNQCNYIVTGAGNNVYCTVSVTNNVPNATPTTGVTVNQCNNSAYGGGSTMACNPTASTTDATVTQCDYSVYGGGTYNGEPTAGCTVAGASSADPVTVNQCNYSAYGGGSAVTCSGSFANVFAPAATTPTPTGTSGTGGTTGTGASGAAAGGTSTATGLAGGSGGAVGAGGSTGTGSGVAGASGTVASVIPTGAPQTGFGGASRSTSPAFLYVGGVALVGAVLTMILALRRRRRTIVESLQNHVS
jgi:hypothetical protein